MKSILVAMMLVLPLSAFAQYRPANHDDIGLTPLQIAERDCKTVAVTKGLIEVAKQAKVEIASLSVTAAKAGLSGTEADNEFYGFYLTVSENGVDKYKVVHLMKGCSVEDTTVSAIK